MSIVLLGYETIQIADSVLPTFMESAWHNAWHVNILKEYLLSNAENGAVKLISSGELGLETNFLN